LPMLKSIIKNNHIARWIFHARRRNAPSAIGANRDNNAGQGRSMFQHFVCCFTAFMPAQRNHGRVPTSLQRPHNPLRHWSFSSSTRGDISNAHYGQSTIHWKLSFQTIATRANRRAIPNACGGRERFHPSWQRSTH